jgi:outer membrane protein assembly factor BamB
MNKITNLIYRKRSSAQSIIILGLILAILLVNLAGPNPLVNVQASSGNNYFVRASGSDSNLGSQDKPWKTIQKAANSMVGGDTVTVLAGDYSTERVAVTTSGGSGSPITFIAQGSVTMKGFTVKANYIVRNNKSDTNSQVGVEVYGRNNLVESNEVWGTIQYHPKWTNSPSWVDADGMRFFGQGHIFRNNYIHDIKYGVTGNVNPHIDCFQTFADGYHEAASNILFEQNNCNIPVYQAAVEKGSAFTIENGSNLIIRNNILQAFLNIYINNGSSIIIENNIITGNLSFPDSLSPGGIFLGNTPNMTIRNNVFYNIPGYTIYTGASTSQQNLSAGYNWIYWNNGKSASGKVYPNDTFNVDPKFVDSSNNNFQLQAISPMIDVGFAVTDVPNDYAGVSRPQGKGVDVGPFEFVGSVPSATNTPTTIPVTSTNTSTLGPTATQVPPTATRQNTPTQTTTLPSTATSTLALTATQVPPTATLQNTATQMANDSLILLPTGTPTQTNTIPLPTGTSTITQVPSATSTSTSTQIPTSIPSTGSSLCLDCGLADSPWPMLGGNTALRSQSAFTGPNQATVKWTFSNGSSTNSSPVLDANNNLYVGMGSKLVSLSPAGKVLWFYKTAGTVNTPLLTASGILYFTSSDGRIYSVAANNGSVNWTFLTHGPITSSPNIAANGTLYVTSTDGHFYAINSGNGTLKWSYDLINSPINSSPALLNDGSIVFGASNGKLYNLRADGSLNWVYTAGGALNVSPAISLDNTIYIGSTNGNLYAVSKTGSLVWTYHTGGAVTSPALGADGTIYIGSADKSVYAISPTGSLKWSFKIGGVASAPMVGGDGTIYVGSQAGSLLAINQDGTLKWKTTINQSTSIYAVIGSGGNFIVASGGKVYGFK